MPMFMDVHHLPEPASPDDVAGAHQKDMEIQEQYGVEYVNYWLSDDGRTIFCLASAPDADAARRVHQEAHGLVADEIHPVTQG